MGRRRSINPEQISDVEFSSMSLAAQFLFTHLPCHADREGRMIDSPMHYKLKIFPILNVDLYASFDEIEGRGFIIRYEIGGKKYLQIRSFEKYQKPHKTEKLSSIPGPTDHLLCSCTTTENSMLSGGSQCHSLDLGSATEIPVLLPVSTDQPVDLGSDRSGLWSLVSGSGSLVNTDPDLSPSNPSSTHSDEAEKMKTPRASRLASDLPDSLPEVTTPKQRKLWLVGFDEFWKLYPKKVGKLAAKKAWDKSRPPLDVVLKKLERDLASKQWAQEGGKYVRDPVRWISVEEWTDVAIEPQAVVVENRPLKVDGVYQGYWFRDLARRIHEACWFLSHGRSMEDIRLMVNLKGATWEILNGLSRDEKWIAYDHEGLHRPFGTHDWRSLLGQLVTE